MVPGGAHGLSHDPRVTGVWAVKGSGLSGPWAPHGTGLDGTGRDGTGRDGTPVGQQGAAAQSNVGPLARGGPRAASGHVPTAGPATPGCLDRCGVALPSQWRLQPAFPEASGCWALLRDRTSAPSLGARRSKPIPLQAPILRARSCPPPKCQPPAPALGLSGHGPRTAWCVKALCGRLGRATIAGRTRTYPGTGHPGRGFAHRDEETD